MVEAEKGFLDVPRHRHVKGSVGVIPIQVQTTEVGALPVGGDGVL